MKIIYGTTDKKQVEYLQNIINSQELDIQVLSLLDINWNYSKIESVGATLEERSLIKADSILRFCKDNDIECPIVTDEVDLLYEGFDMGNLETHYIDEKSTNNKTIIKSFKSLNNKKTTHTAATYRCCVTCMMPDETYFQELGESRSYAIKNIIENLKKSCFYSIFVLNGYGKAFNYLSDQKVGEASRYKTLKKALMRINK